MEIKRDVLDTTCEYCGLLHRNCNLIIYDGGVKRFACHLCTKKIAEDNTEHINGEVKDNGAINVGRRYAGKKADVYIRL